MKALINSDMKAIRMGEFVTARDDAGEFIYDSDVPPSTAVLNGIAEANGIKVSSKMKAAELNEAVAAGISQKKIPQVNEMTETQKVEAIVKAAHEAGKSEDEILVEIVNSGVPFKSAGKLFRKSMESLGFTVSTKDRFKQAVDIATKMKFKPKTYDEVVALQKKLVTEIKGTTDKQAMAVIRRIAKEYEIELPKAPKRSGGRGGFRAKVYDWMVANPKASADDLKKYITGEMEKDEKVANRFVPILEFAQKFAAATKG